MYNQSLSSKELYTCSTQAERRNYGLKKNEFIEAIDKELGNSLIDNTYQFIIKESGGLFLNGREKRTFGYLCQNLILRKLFNNIKRIYKVEQSDRNTIVKQIKVLLEENVDIWVVRMDVKKFYESIDRSRITLKMKRDNRLSYDTINLLQKLFDVPTIVTNKGLPKGIGVSAALSELYMKYLDLNLKRVEGAYYYARFVDDIIVFCSTELSAKNIWKCAENNLSNLGLELNKRKSYIWNPNQESELTYLGYTFFKSKNKLKICIAEKKQKTIKTRIVKSFVRYSKDRDFNMLKMRLKFLTGNFTLYQADTLIPTKVGIFFNYRMATDIKALDEIDRFYQRILHCQHGKLGSRIRLTKKELKDIEKYSFRFGFNNHVNHHFSIDKMIKITRCWQ